MSRGEPFARRVNDMAGNRASVARADETFIELRPLLFSIADRMLGSVARQVFARARGRIEAGTPRFEASAERAPSSRGGSSQHATMATSTGCSSSSPPTRWRSDGGGKAYAAKEPIHGAQRVATFLIRLFEQRRRSFRERTAWSIHMLMKIVARRLDTRTTR
jgi:hypothetical protein